MAAVSGPFKPTPLPSQSHSSAQPAAQAELTPEKVRVQMRKLLVDKAAESVNGTLRKVFGDEINVMKREYEKNGKLPEGAKSYRLVTGTDVVIMRPEHLRSQLVRPSLEKDVKNLSPQQTKCYKAIMAACINKIGSLDKYLPLGTNLGQLEPDVLKETTVDFQRSQILSSKALFVVLTAKGPQLDLFNE